MNNIINVKSTHKIITRSASPLMFGSVVLSRPKNNTSVELSIEHPSLLQAFFS